MLSVITNEDERAEMAVSLDEICRQGAQQMLAAALEAEVADYVDAMSGEVDENGHRLVRRNGRHEPRTITTAAGKVEIHQPRVDDRRTDPTTGEKLRFASSLIPPWARKSPKVSAVLPLLYLHGMSSGDFSPALTEFFGHDAGLSASSITRLTTDWQAEQREFMNRDLTDHDYVYVWVDGVHFNVRLEEARLCCLVIVGVTLDGTKELVAIVDGYRESTESWLDLLRDLDRRGMKAPTLAVGDGALGFWNALEQIWPTTVPQRDWVHKVANILDAMPKTAQRTAKKMLDEIRNAEDGELARKAAAKFDQSYRAKFPKAADKPPTISTSCSRSMTTQPTTGSISRRRIRSSPHSPPSANAPKSPEAQAAEPLDLPWPTSSSAPPKTAGAASTHPTSPHSSEPAPHSRKDN